MKDYPNEKALYNSHRKYLDAMREFIFSYLEKMAPGEAEELIGLELNCQPSDDVKAAIDFGDIPHIFQKYWGDFFKQRFGYNKQRNFEGYDIRSVTRLISECRNRGWGHPGVGDLDPEFTRACLFLITDVLKEIGKLDAKREVEEIRDQLFSDDLERQPAQVDQIAAYKKRLATMSTQLAMAVAGKTTAGERFSDISNRLEAAEIEKTELEKRLKTMSDRLKDVERENAAYNKPLEPIPVSDNSPDSVTFQGTTFTKLLNEYHVAGDDISQSFWHYWQLQGREGKQEMRDAGWSIEKVDGDWEVMISPEDFQAWIMDEVTELKNLLDFLRNEEPSTQPIHPFYERTSLPTVREMEQPALRVLADGKEHRRVEIIDYLTEHFSLTDDERSYLSKTGQAEKHLMSEGLIERTRTGYYRITTLGRRKVRTA